MIRTTILAMTLAAPAMLAAHMAATPAAPLTAPPSNDGHRAPERLPACQACHGVDGVATFGPAPNLAGQKADYLVAQLSAFRNGTRKSDFMNPIATQLSDREIAELAGHFASLPPAGSLAADARSAGAVATKVAMPTGFPKDFVEYARSDDTAAGTVAVIVGGTQSFTGRQNPSTGGLEFFYEQRYAVNDTITIQASQNLTTTAAGNYVSINWFRA